ncbi:PP2C family serine/threonine-protein phosphatase [uncultured Enterovirga sp.]|uniref:PP2C family serine/threonine-protein phosphatase n=1 Tax=uncultured Enterovirga sp. TaxID=2026352 RepID=UPI0035CB5C9B
MTVDGPVGGISVRGSSHARSDMPNQDAVGHAREGAWTFLAVADGHGSSRHYRSDRGATFAVETVLTLLGDLARRSTPGEIGRALPTLAQDLVAGWRERVEADIRLSPLRERPGFESHVVYGATCLAAAIGPDAALFIQIGDGDVLAAPADGEVDRAIPLDPHLIGPGTYSLCQPDAIDRVHLRLFAPPHPWSRPDFVMVSTDGLSKSYPEDAQFLAVVRHVRASLRTTQLPALLRQLEPWLAEVSGRGSRDDATIAVFAAPDVGESTNRERNRVKMQF